MLILSAIWLAFLSRRLLRKRHQTLATISLLALTGASGDSEASARG
jgi:hypothetical protein